MVTICRKYQNSRNYVMGEHLHVVLSSCFNMDNQQLLHPESVLYQNIGFQRESHLSIRPIRPEPLEIEPVFRVHQYVLVFR